MINRKIEISIIVVNFNGKKFLKNFFTSLGNSGNQQFEVIFFDNASADGSVEWVKRNYPKATTIPSSENIGFALANNQAASIAKGKYFLFLNPDLRVEGNFIRLMLDKMEQDKSIGICGCQIRSYDGKRHFHTGIGIDIFGFPLVWRKLFYIEGSALMISKNLFEKVGGFDRDYFMFHEDIDLAWRVWLSGYRVEALREAVVYHFGGAVAAGGEKVAGKYQTSILRRYYSERNNFRTLLKNYRFSTLLVILPLYLLINFMEIIICLLTLNFRLVFLYFKAYFWNAANLKGTIEKRQKIQTFRKISDSEILKKMFFGSGKFIAFKRVGMPSFR